jgi:sigma-54-specific transcriptional regulator
MPLLTLSNADDRPLTVRAKALVFEDPRSRAVLDRLEQVAPSEATVLVIGETGTGKEIVARHLHDLSPRARRPFVAVNCGAFSETLVESELFGHDKGAFTGAIGAKPGWFEAANGGTLFLDEIGDLPPPVQVKLLRVLQEREVVRLGSRQAIPIDVRLVAATNVKLEQAVAAGRFREDLYYRLKVAVLELPALRERPGDVMPLAGYFLAQYRERLGLPQVTLGPDAVERLLDHTWPGNIRELENVIHSALIVARGGIVRAHDLGLTTARTSAPHAETTSTPAPASPLAALERALVALFDRNVPDLHAQVEGALMKAAYEYCHRNQLQTARLLGISRNVVRARLVQLGVLPGTLRAVPVNDTDESSPA